MRITDGLQLLKRSNFSFDSFVKGAKGEEQSKPDTGQGRGEKPSGGQQQPGGGAIPVEPDGGIGDGAGPIPVDPDGNGPIATTLAIGEEDGGGFSGTPIPVEPDGGIGDGAGPIPKDPDDGGPTFTTLALGEEDGGAGPIPVEPDGGIGDGAGPIPSGPIPVEPDGGIGDGAGPIPGDASGPGIGPFEGGPIGGGPIPVDPDDKEPIFTTLALGEEDGGGGPIDEGGPIGGGRDGDVITGTKGNDTLDGTNGDDLIRGKNGDDVITTGQGNDTVRGGRGDDVISVTGTGDKQINGGKGNDILELKGVESDYAINSGRDNGTTVYTSADGSRITARNIESVQFTGVTPPEPPTDPGFVAFYDLNPNELGATSLNITGEKAVLIGPGTNFTFTGVDPSGLAVDGPLIATGGSGTINGEETTAVPLSQFGDAVLTIGSGFNPTGTQPVSASFANGATLDTTVAAVALP